MNFLVLRVCGWKTGWGRPSGNRNKHEALKTLIPALLNQHYPFVTVSELLQAGTPVKATQRYQLREGDNLRYDKLFGEGIQ
jgi:hypothetical protein